MKLILSRVALATMLVAAGSAAFAAPPLAEVKSEADLSQHFDPRAKVRVLNVWATWCTPCVAEMPALQAIHADYRKRGVSLVALSMDDVLPGNRDEARNRVSKFIEAKSITFPSVLFVGNLTAFESELELSGEIPVTIVFDARGHELARVEGVLDETAFRAELDRVLASKPPSTK